MKHFKLLILLLVIGFVAEAQINYLPMNSRYRWIAGKFDSTLHIPSGSTPSLRTGGHSGSGALFYKTSDSSVYVYTGTQWIKMQGTNIDTSAAFVTSLIKRGDSVFYKKGATYTFAFKDSTGGGSTDTTSLSTRINAKADTSAVVKIDTTGKATGKIPKWDATYGGFKMANDSVGTGGTGSGAFSKLEWFPGDENAPANGDTVLVHDSFPGKYLDVYRDGIKQPQVYNDTGFYRVNDSTIWVKPPFSSADKFWHIEARDSTAYTQLTLQAPSTPAPTTIAYVSGTDGGNNGGSTSSRTFSRTTSSGTDRILLVGFVGDLTSGNDDVSSVTYNGVAMTLANKTDNNSRYMYLYYLLNPDAGAHNVVITFGSSHWILAGASEYTGVQGIDVQTTNKHSGGTPSTLTTSLTTTVDNCWTVLYSSGGSVTQSAGAGATKRVEDGATFWSWFDSGAAISPAGSHSMTTTVGAGSLIGHCMIALKPY